MKLYTKNILGKSMQEISHYLENNDDITEEIKGKNLRGGDFIESLAQEILYNDPEVIETTDFEDACK